MKKIFAKIISFILTITCMFGLTACGAATVDNTVEDEKNLKIIAFERGYGVQMIKDWAAAFEKTKPGINVDVEIAVEQTVLSTKFKLGPRYNDIDIFFDAYNLPAGLDYTFRNAFEGYKGHGLMDYTEFYNENVYGEEITVKDKVNSSVLALMQGLNNDGHYYGFSWALALQSIVVNDVVATSALGSGYKLPNTTDELETFCQNIKNAGYTPFTYPGLIDYWAPCFYTWWAQYEGLENYRQFYNGKIYDEGQEQYIYSADIYKQQGRYESLYVMQQLLDADKGYHLSNVNDYNANNFTVLQKAFLNSKTATSNSRKYVMFPNGDWLASESGSSSTDKIIMMQMPVISSIITQCSSIEDDAELSKLIDAIDNRSTALSGDGYNVSQTDFDRIYEARNIVYGQASRHVMYSPVYANAKTLIKEFLAFITSDEGCRIYNRNVKSAAYPVTYESEVTSDAFVNSVAQLKNKSIITNDSNSLLYLANGVVPTSYNSGYYEAVLGIKKSSKQYRTAKQIYESEFVSDAAFTQILNNLNII